VRAYAIKIDGAPSAFPVVAGSQIGAQWDSLPNGVNDPNAQDVEWSIDETEHAVPGSNCQVTIHGIPFDQIKQASDLVDKTASIYGGMAEGLPLATAEAPHRGLLVSGKINQCWASWIGTEMSLSMIITNSGTTPVGTGGDGGGAPGTPSAGSGQIGFVGNVPPGGGHVPGPVLAYNRVGPRSLDRRDIPVLPASQISLGGIASVATSLLSNTGFAQIGGVMASFFGGGGSIAKPLNLIHNLMPNLPLADAIRQTLSTVFPSAKLDIRISPGLKLPFQDAGMYQSLAQYAAYLKQLSHSILGTRGQGYAGVQISSRGNTIHVWDGTQETDTVQIEYYDLIGQPTWIGPQRIQVKVVMRSDCWRTKKIVLPPTLQNMTAEAGYGTAAGNPKSGSVSFQGTFTIYSVLHIGAFRNPDGSSWCTILDCDTSGATDGAKPAADQTDKSNKDQNPAPGSAVATIFGPGTTVPPGTAPVMLSGTSIRRSVRRY
jgi:hypothetical protein